MYRKLLLIIGFILGPGALLFGSFVGIAGFASHNRLLQLIFLIWLAISGFLCILGICFGKIGHALFDWHKPDGKFEDLGFGCIISHCKYCGKEIQQDSQGNWF